MILESNVATRLTVPEVIDAARSYYDAHSSLAGGNLHILLEDGNVRDSDVQFCIRLTEANRDNSGNALAKKLLLMTRTQRKRVVYLCRKL
jgi:hypothetical protein